MEVKRVIACLDVKEGRVVKGVNFIDFKDAGDPVELAAAYSAAGADEVVFLDITATREKRRTMVDLASRVSKEVQIPFAVGGGFRTVEDIRTMIEAGANKVSVNSAAVADPSLLNSASQAFGAPALVCAIDARKINGGGDKWVVYVNGGHKATGIDVVAWAEEVARRGAG